MTEKELQEYIQLHFPKENERCEWKAFGNLTYDVSGHKGEDVISYVSAIANMRGGHLVIGVEDQTLNITGIQNFHDYTPENLPARITGNCTHLITEGLYVENYTTADTNKTVWIIHIPKHAPRKPVIAHKQPWQRLGDNLVRLTHERESAILSEPLSNIEDWSAAIVPDAAIDDLDPAAIAKARENYKNKFPHQAHGIDRWDDITFLNKAKVIIKGKITRTAIILLGKPESEHFISPAKTKIRWLLKDVKGNDKDYHIESCPLLLAVDKIYAKIRNLKYRYIKDGSLFPDEEIKYLKELGLIEGRKPNYVISAKITASLSNDELKAHYIKQRGLDDEHYKNLIVEYLKKFGESPRKNIEKFLRDKLPDILTESQKKNKVTNLLSALRIKGIICNNGYSKWALV